MLFAWLIINTCHKNVHLWTAVENKNLFRYFLHGKHIHLIVYFIFASYDGLTLIWLRLRFVFPARASKLTFYWIPPSECSTLLMPTVASSSINGYKCNIDVFMWSFPLAPQQKYAVGFYFCCVWFGDFPLWRGQMWKLHKRDSWLNSIYIHQWVIAFMFAHCSHGPTI